MDRSSTDSLSAAYAGGPEVVTGFLTANWALYRVSAAYAGGPEVVTVYCT
ncbi:MAG: hypothetical protein OXH85_01655 [Truepera sp.]|nr:hypothetical protein [Truepera sp.]